MIILVIQQVSLSVPELECDTPVSIDPNRSAAAISAFERVQLEPWHVHITNYLGSLQCDQQHPQSFRMLRLDPIQAAGFIKTPQPFVANGLDH